MRLSAALFAFLALSAPTLAADSIADQARAAYATFAGGLSQEGYLNTGYGTAVLKDVAGNWVRLDGPDTKTGIETYGVDTEKFCKGPAALTLASPDPYTLTLTTNLPGNNFSQTYTLVAGSTFGESTNALPYLNAIGLGPDNKAASADQQRALVLSLANGLVQMYRPSGDILVMTRDRGYPLILARCPAAASN